MAPRFNPNSDILLLKEVVAVNPYATVKGRNKWEEVVNSLNEVDGGVDKNAFKIKSCQTRIRTLLEAHKNKEMASLKASGTDEEYTERDALLTDLVDLIEETNTEMSNTKDKRAEETQKELKGVMIREAAMQSLKRNTPHVESHNEGNEEKDVARVDETPRRKRRSDIVEDYMSLRRDQLALERERFELDKKEREAMQAREKKESDQRMARDIAMMEILKKLSEK